MDIYNRRYQRPKGPTQKKKDAHIMNRIFICESLLIHPLNLSLIYICLFAAALRNNRNFSAYYIYIADGKHGNSCRIVQAV